VLESAVELIRTPAIGALEFQVTPASGSRVELWKCSAEIPVWGELAVLILG
jgi:hypothetical protein